MKLFNDIILGTYDPKWKSIFISDDAIFRLEKKNPDILQNLVYVHENFHWLQLNSSSIGHIISMMPFFEKKIVSSMIGTYKYENGKKEINKPFLDKKNQLSEIIIKILNNDQHAINKTSAFLVNTNSDSEVIDNYTDINQCLFSCFDCYLGYSQEILTQNLGDSLYKNLVKANRDFWDNEKINRLTFYEDIPLIGFKDLVECSARIVEIKHYHNLIDKYSFLDINKDIDDSYLYHEDYFKPMIYVNYIFPVEEINIVQDFLLIAIHISINPSIVPFYTSTYVESNSISDIHPGMRFIKILNFIKNRYKCISRAMEEKNIYNIIINNLGWQSDTNHYDDLRNFYSNTYDKISSIDDRKSILDCTKFFDIEYLFYKYYEIMKIKKTHQKYFIDPSDYLNNIDLLDVTLEIENQIHCPVIYNEIKKQYQINLSGTDYQFLNEKGSIIDFVSTKKKNNDNRSQEFLNYIILGIYNELDKQLLYEEGAFDFSIFDKFDITPKIKKEIIEIYLKDRSIAQI